MLTSVLRLRAVIFFFENYAGYTLRLISVAGAIRSFQRFYSGHRRYLITACTCSDFRSDSASAAAGHIWRCGTTSGNVLNNQKYSGPQPLDCHVTLLIEVTPIVLGCVGTCECVPLIVGVLQLVLWCISMLNIFFLKLRLFPPVAVHLMWCGFPSVSAILCAFWGRQNCYIVQPWGRTEVWGDVCRSSWAWNQREAVDYGVCFVFMIFVSSYFALVYIALEYEAACELVLDWVFIDILGFCVVKSAPTA